MKRGRYRKEYFCRPVKEYPGNPEAQSTLEQPEKRSKTLTAGGFGLEPFGQALGAEHSVFMFGYAFTTEKTTAFRTTGHRFTFGMIETPLTDQVVHI